MGLKRNNKQTMLVTACASALFLGVAGPAVASQLPALESSVATSSEQSETVEAQGADDQAALFDDQNVVPGHSVSFQPKTPIPETSIADISLHGIPEGWHVTINEDNAHVVVSAAPNAKKGDSITVKVKIVDLDGRVEWHEVKVTASRDGDEDFAQPPADPDGPQVTYADAVVNAGRSVSIEPEGDLQDDTIYGIAQHGIPKGWYVRISDAGKLSVSAAMDAKSGDTYTANVKIVDIDGKIAWAHPTITVK